MIFIGFTNYDEAAASALATALKAAGVDVYCSAVPGTIKGGSFWQQIEHAIDTCDAFIELCGTNPPSKSSESEIVTANNRLARGSKFLIVPVLLPGVAPSAIHISLRAYECVELTVDPAKFSAADKSDFVERLRGLGALSSSLSSKSAARLAEHARVERTGGSEQRAPTEAKSRTKTWMLTAIALIAVSSLGYVAWRKFGGHNDPLAGDRRNTNRPSSDGTSERAPPNDNVHDTSHAGERPTDRDAASTDTHERVPPNNNDRDRPQPNEPLRDNDVARTDPPATPDRVRETNLDPYNAWKLPKPQAGLLALGPDRASRLEEFAVETTGSIPWRDGTGALVINARPALPDPKCAVVLVLIPGGSFRMGSSDTEGIVNERPQHGVDIKPFFIAKTEVTQAQWERVMSSGSSKSLLPATDISWVDAGKFCEKLQLTRPTEAQWEYACRAGTTTAFSFGDDVRELSKYAWPRNDADPRAREIAGKLPNPWGMFDMHGNVSEWCEDSFREHYNNVPLDGSAFVEASNVRRTMRGGNFTFNDDFMRSAARGMYKGAKGAEFVGFRPARPVRD